MSTTSMEDVLGELVKDRQKGLVVTPMLRTFLSNADFPDDFTIRFKKGDQRRDPDGWFWPSTHPTQTMRLLWLYLNEPESLPVEHREYMNTLALTMGTALHGFNEMVLEKMGLRPQELNTCRACPPEKGCTEPGFVDEETGTRGHMDGNLDISSLAPLPPGMPEIVGYEYKTASERVIKSLEDLNVDLYRQKKPEYYGQNQEYMRISGLSMVIVVFQQLGWPWTFKEIHVPYDEAFARTTRDKYLAVRAAKEMPECCGKRSCALADFCSVTPRKSDNVFLMSAPRRRRT